MTCNGSNRAVFGPYEVDVHTHELWKYGTRLKLVGQPFEILVELLRRKGELVTRDELRQHLWPSDTFVDFNHGLNAAVNKLRDALSDSADSPRYIETLPRRGYRFIADVAWLPAAAPVGPAEGAVAQPAQEAEPVPETVVVQSEARPNRWRTRRYLIPVATSLFLLLVGVGIVLWHSRTEPAQAMVEHTRPLTSVSGVWNPSFSPDGNSVAFFHEGAEGAGIYTNRIGSQDIRQITNRENDCCPVWSADGRWIAFTRFVDQEHSIYVVPADNGGEQKRQAEAALGHAAAYSGPSSLERKLETGGVKVGRGEIDWSPSGNLIAFASTSGIYVMAPDNSGLRRISQAPPAAEDWAPQFSPDGSRVMFVRTHQIGEPDELWAVPVGGGEGTRIVAERGRIASPPQWSSDGRSVIFAANRSGHPSLFRVSLDAPESVAVVSEASSPAWDPAVSRAGHRLAYARLIRGLSIWQLNLSEEREKRPEMLVAATSNTDQGPGPQFSPDGKKLAYMSDRNGTMEIWIANRDGSNPYQLTAVGGAGTPRWSPDGQSVAFDISTTTGERIVTLNLRGGAPQQLAAGECPSWSRDGKWIYYAYGAAKDSQVWKVPAAGGNPVQVTQHGGHAAFESPDGEYVYYAKNGLAEPEIWRVPVNGGEETAVPLVHPGTWASWQPVDGGILFVGPSLGHQAVLSFFDFAKNRTSTVAVLERVPFWMGATTDGKTVAFDQLGREEGQVMLVENFR